MLYEEYRDRMAAQKREPRDRERYEAYIEPAYMACEMSKDEFCNLPDAALDAMEMLVRLEREAQAEAMRSAGLKKELADEITKAAAEITAVRKERDELATKLEIVELRSRRLEECLRKALGQWPTQMLVDEIVQQYMRK